MQRTVRSWMKDAATITVIGATGAGAWTLAGAGVDAHARTAPAPAPALVRFAEVPSHDGLYRASLLPAAGTLAVGREIGAVLEVATADGRAVEGAALAFESRLPDLDRAAASQPRVVRELGGGRYSVQGLRFEQPGLWNVKLAVTAPSGTDSLAFNVLF